MERISSVSKRLQPLHGVGCHESGRFQFSLVISSNVAGAICVVFDLWHVLFWLFTE
jgi:hypothetical protein